MWSFELTFLSYISLDSLAFYLICISGAAPLLYDYLMQITKLKEKLVEFYGEDPFNSADISHIVNKMHFQRLFGLLNHESTVEKVIHGGQVNEKEL